MSSYLQPYKITKTKLSQLFYFNNRQDPLKPGRSLTAIYHKEAFSSFAFDIKYAYLVRFLAKNNTAGHHYHRRKKEIYIPIIGTFTVKLENIETKEQETFEINHQENVCCSINTGVAHAVTAQNEGNILLVLASDAVEEEDSFSYQIL